MVLHDGNLPLGSGEAFGKSQQEFMSTSILRLEIIQSPCFVSYHPPFLILPFPVDSAVKNLPTVQETGVQSLVWEYPLEKGMTTHSSVFAWRVPEEPGGLQSMGSQRAGYD